MSGIGNRIKAYAPEWYDYPKSDGLTKRDNAQNKNAENANRCYVLPPSTNNFFPYHSIFVNYFHTTQSQYMLSWLLKDAQLTCNRCPFEA